MATKISQLPNASRPLRHGDLLPIVQSGHTSRVSLADFRGDNFVSVKDFGAGGKNKTDDTSAIQKALDTGLPVYFPSGTYRVSDTLDQTRGKSPAILAKGRYAKLLATNRNKPILRVTGSIIMDNLHFAGGGASDSDTNAVGIELLNVVFSTFRNLTFSSLHGGFRQPTNLGPNVLLGVTFDTCRLQPVIGHCFRLEPTGGFNSGLHFINTYMIPGHRTPAATPFYLRRTSEAVCNQFNIEGLGNVKTCADIDDNSHVVINAFHIEGGKITRDTGQFVRLGAGSSCIINHMTISNFDIFATRRWYCLRFDGDNAYAELNGHYEKPNFDVSPGKWRLATTGGVARRNCQLRGHATLGRKLDQTNATFADLKSGDGKPILRQWNDKVFYYEENGRSQRSGTAAPKSGQHSRGDMVWNEKPVAGGPIGWVCVDSGSPGKWRTFAQVAS